LINIKRSSTWIHLINLSVGISLFVCAVSFVEALSKSIMHGINKFDLNIVIISNKKINSILDSKNTPLNIEVYQILNQTFSREYEVIPIYKE